MNTNEAILATMSGATVYFYQVDELVPVSLESLEIREQAENAGKCAPGYFVLNTLALATSQQ